MAPKKKTNKKKEDLEEKILEEPVIKEAVVKEVEPPVTLEPEPPVTLEPEPPVTLEPEPPVTLEPEPPVTLEPEPPVAKKLNDSKIDLQVNEILNPILSNDLENLLIKNTDRPKSPIPQKRINKRGATMGMKLGL